MFDSESSNLSAALIVKYWCEIFCLCVLNRHHLNLGISLFALAILEIIR